MPGRNERGAASAEHGMLVAAIAGVVLVILLALGQHVQRLFDHTCDAVGTQPARAESCE